MRRDIAAVAASTLLAAFVVSPSTRGAEPMTHVAKGTFTVQMKPQADADSTDGIALGQLELSKAYEGDLAATAEGHMLTAMTPVQGSAAYVAIERITGTLHGRKGSFVLQHMGTMNRGEQFLSIAIVPDSGTGELSGISGGEFRLRIEGKTHYYELEYRL